MLLGAVASVNLAQGLWRVAGLGAGAFAAAKPVRALAGAVGGRLLGRITSPRLLVHVMALLTGWSAASVVAQVFPTGTRVQVFLLSGCVAAGTRGGAGLGDRG
jgi:hypothetical protein